MRPPATPRELPRECVDRALRVFFALWPDASVRDALATLSRDAAAQWGGRATAPENLHLTLSFVGDVASARVESLCAIGHAAAASLPAFRLSLDNVGEFRGAGIAWAGASAIPAELAEMVRRLNDKLAACGFTPDQRRFHPHVTLARRSRMSRSFAIAPPISWIVTRMTLNASERSSGGARYSELGGWPLGPRASGNAGGGTSVG